MGRFSSKSRKGRRSSNDSESKVPVSSYHCDHHVPGLKSCMKVATVEESLRNANENEARGKSMAGEGSRFSMLKKGLSIRGKSKRGIASTRGMSRRGISFRNGKKNGSTSRRSSLSRGLSKMGGFLSRRGLGRKPTLGEIDEEPGVSPTEAPSEHSRRSKVSFDTLLIRWYELKAVDNPGVSKGFAIGIGWEYEEDESPTPVDVHEEYRATKEPRRKMKEIKLTEEERYRRLIGSGVSQAELARVRKQINIAKGRRKKTLEGAANMEKDERREGAIRKLKKMLGMKKGYEEEVKELWNAAQKRDSNINNGVAVMSQ